MTNPAHSFGAAADEYDRAMLARPVAAGPGATAVAGSAESLPLPDGTADAVVAGQAYHWFDRDGAHAEAARVLRPGGVFAPTRVSASTPRTPWSA